MSWSFTMVGTNRLALRAAVQVTSAPQAVRDELCSRIDSLPLRSGQVIYVASHGHLEGDTLKPYHGVDELVLRVRAVDYVPATSVS